MTEGDKTRLQRWKEARAENAGTWIPLALGLLFMVLYIEALGSGKLTWERPVGYAIGVLTLPFGLYRIWNMAQRSGWSYLLLGLAYDIFCFLLIYTAILMFALNDLVPWVPVLSEPLAFALLVTGIVMAGIVNFVILFFDGGRGGVLDRTSDPMPFRPFYRRWKAKRDRRRNLK